MKSTVQVRATPKPRVLQALVRLAILAILVTAAGLWLWEKAPLASYLDRLPWFQIQDLQIHSEWPLTPDTVKKWLPPLEGKSILSVRATDLIALLEQKPWVASVTIKKEYPNRLILDLETRRAEAVAIARGQGYFLDPRGQVIDRAIPGLLRALDLPVISFEKESEAAHWPMAGAVRILEVFRAGMDPHYALSQVVLGSYPYFQIFLSHPRMEVAFNFENWETQLPILALLLHSPPNQIGQPQKINLVFPKKAVVTNALPN